MNKASCVRNPCLIPLSSTENASIQYAKQLNQSISEFTQCKLLFAMYMRAAWKCSSHSSIPSHNCFHSFIWRVNARHLLWTLWLDSSERARVKRRGNPKAESHSGGKQPTAESTSVSPLLSVAININRPIGMVKYHYYSSSCISRDFKITSIRLCNKLYVVILFFLVDNFY